MRSALVALVAGSMLGLAGCSGDAPEKDGEPTAGQEPTGAPASGARVQEVAYSTFVDQVVPVDGSTTDTVTVGVQSLVVDGATMTLTLVYTPRFGSKDAAARLDLYELTNPDAATEPVLLDRQNLKEYRVIEGSGSTWRSNLNETEVTNGSPVLFWAVYAAPQDDIETLDIRVSSSWPEFLGVPIAR